MTAAPEALEQPIVVPTESELLDVLYEVLAQGVPPRGSLSTEDVESFLHEHARNRKSVEEMLAFFRKHGLPTDACDYGADPALGALASGLHKERGPVSATFHLDETTDARLRAASESGPVRRVEQVPELETDPRARVIETAPVQSRGSWAMAAASLASVLVLGGALFATYRHAQDLSVELAQARLQQRSTDQALISIEQRAEALKTVLSQSEAERQALASRFDEFVSGEAQKRAAEEVALERLLGQRYETLRDRALREAMLKAEP